MASANWITFEAKAASCKHSAFLIAVLSGASSAWNNRISTARVDWILGLSIAFAWKGLDGVMSIFPPESLSGWPTFFNAANYVSWWTGNLSLYGYFFGSSILMGLIVNIIYLKYYDFGGYKFFSD